MLESLKSGGINNTGDLICTEHSLHRRLDEFDGDFPDNFAPDILCAKFLNSLRVILREDMRVFLRFFPGDGLISTKMASTSGPRQAGISEQLSIADRSKCVYELIMFIHYTFRENALLKVWAWSHRLKTWPGFYSLWSDCSCMRTRRKCYQGRSRVKKSRYAGQVSERDASFS
jgi:hypothetical protein